MLIYGLKDRQKWQEIFIPVSEDDSVNLDRLQCAGKEGLYFFDAETQRKGGYELNGL